MIIDTVSPDGRRLSWRVAGKGTAALRLPGGDLEIAVEPAARRTGVGTRLLAAATRAAAARGLTAMLTEAVDEGSPGDQFCTARGLRPVLALTYARLALGPATPEIRPVPGYRVIHWEGAVADGLAETFARSRSAMDDMPMDDAAWTPAPWDVARLHAIAAAVAGRGEILNTTAVLDGTGEIAGFTEVVIRGDRTGEGRHYGTGVLPAHRGRGLARWMKAEQIARLRVRFPGVDALLADTADSNTAMRRVNAALGYRDTHHALVYQVDVVPNG